MRSRWFGSLLPAFRGEDLVIALDQFLELGRSCLVAGRRHVLQDQVLDLVLKHDAHRLERDRDPGGDDAGTVIADAPQSQPPASNASLSAVAASVEPAFSKSRTRSVANRRHSAISASVLIVFSFAISSSMRRSNSTSAASSGATMRRCKTSSCRASNSRAFDSSLASREATGLLPSK